jgi:predicted Zn-dependent protease
MSDAPVAARYNDGRVAATHPVTVLRVGAELAIYGGEGAVIATWPVGDIRYVEPPDKSGRIVICRAGEPARLRIDDPAFAAAVSGWAPNLRRDPYARGASTKVIVLSLLGAVVSFAVLIRFLLPMFAAEAARLMPPELEARSGRWISEALIGVLAPSKERAVCDSPAGSEAFAQLAAPLERAAKLRTPLTLRVIRVPMVNAFALPGSQVVFFQELISRANSPNEVAGVLAHELGHVELLHPTENAIKITASSFLIGLLFGDVFGGSAAVIAAQSLIGASYTREAELAADARAVELMAAAGYDMRPYADFFDRLAGNEGRAGRVPSWLATHPQSSQRAERVRAAPTGGKPALSPTQWAALKAICETPK